ncbi:DUF1707 and DUF4870 domain-containing protein [uncultured Friedmanniella sp.]|uniref:DUF1707 and DUF4870 domain-containing protein n=1 Tax=uncultured Friedmanniella sp. TaxID=335381 RepID=UPI0035CA1B83
MPAAYEHPSLQMSVTPEQRDRAEDWLKDAYADGRVSESEFDSRIGQVLGATTRKDLNQAFYGLVHVPSSSTAVGLHPAYQPLVRPEVRDRAGNGVAALAHFSTLFAWLLGPAVIYALSSPGTRARREAAKAFNFTLVTFLGLVGSSIIANVTNLDLFDMLTGVIFVGWVVLTIIGGAKAAQGENWHNPVRHVARLQVLKEK